MIRQDMAHLRLTKDMTLDRMIWKLQIKVEDKLIVECNLLLSYEIELVVVLGSSFLLIVLALFS